MELVRVEENKMMSSKKIAERTGKKHSNVLRDIRNMLNELGESQNSKMNPNDYQEVTSANGMTSEVLLNERLSLCLASGYSISLRMMIIDDWAELKKPKELSRLEVLKLALEAEERALLAESKVELLNTALDNLVEYVSILKVANHNGIHESNFNWRSLKAQSKIMGYEVKKAQSPRFDFQNLYHIDTFKAVYPQYNYDLISKEN